MEVTRSSSVDAPPDSFVVRRGGPRAGGRRPGSDAARTAVLRAEAIIAAHPSAAYSPTTLALAAGVSTRSLARGFQRVRGHSPMEAVRRERLQRVHRDLLTAAAGDRVTDAAMRWGFFHLGRFSSAYAARFGELPSETRRRSQTGRAQPPRVEPVGRSPQECHS